MHAWSTVFCKQKILCIRRDFLYTSKISKILVILTAKPLANEGFCHVVLVRLWKANCFVWVVNGHSAQVAHLGVRVGVSYSSSLSRCLASCFLLSYTRNWWLSEWFISHCSRCNDSGGGSDRFSSCCLLNLVYDTVVLIVGCHHGSSIVDEAELATDISNSHHWESKCWIGTLQVTCKSYDYTRGFKYLSYLKDVWLLATAPLQASGSHWTN